MRVVLWPSLDGIIHDRCCACTARLTTAPMQHALLQRFNVLLLLLRLQKLVIYAAKHLLGPRQAFSLNGSGGAGEPLDRPYIVAFQ